MKLKQKLSVMMLSAAVMCTIFSGTTAYAAETAGTEIKVEIVSPDKIEATPIYEGNVDIAITNISDTEQTDLNCFLTVVDEERKQTFAMDEFGVDSYQTRTIDSLKPQETVTISIPLRVMYVGKFQMLANVVNYKTGQVYMAKALPVTILSNTMLHRNLVWAVSVITPLALAAMTVLLSRKRGVRKTAG